MKIYKSLFHSSRLNIILINIIGRRERKNPKYLLGVNTWNARHIPAVIENVTNILKDALRYKSGSTWY